MLNGFAQFTPRQRIALDRPNTYDMRVSGFIAKDPHTKRVQVVSDPTKEHLPLGTPNRAKAKSKHFQFGTILVIDIETPTPLWHSSCSYLDTANDEDFLVPRTMWSEWMIVHAMQTIRAILPYKRADFEEKVKLDKQKYSLHMRLPVTEMEKSYLTAREFGAVAPLTHLRDPEL